MFDPCVVSSSKADAETSSSSFFGPTGGSYQVFGPSGQNAAQWLECQHLVDDAEVD
jgi:hypothetical protein